MKPVVVWEGVTYFNVYDFKMENGKAYGTLFGKPLEVPLEETKKYKKTEKSTPQSMALHALLAQYRSLYGEPKRPVIRRTHVTNLGNGVSVATGEVDGEVVKEMFVGKVTNSDGKQMDAKPWLGDVRNRLKAKASGDTKETLYKTVSDYVDTIFIKRLIEARFNVELPDYVVQIGDEKVDLLGLTQVEATVRLKEAIDRFRKAKAENDRKGDEFFKEGAA